jgi:hypothetical protein
VTALAASKKVIFRCPALTRNAALSQAPPCQEPYPAQGQARVQEGSVVRRSSPSYLRPVLLPCLALGVLCMTLTLMRASGLTSPTPTPTHS